MVKIIFKCKEGGNYQLCNHVTSLFKLLHVTRVNESMHPRMVFNWVEDCLGNLVNRLKDWHQIMLKNVDSCNEKIWE
jgi:hypothetical protein